MRYHCRSLASRIEPAIAGYRPTAAGGRSGPRRRRRQVGVSHRARRLAVEACAGRDAAAVLGAPQQSAEGRLPTRSSSAKRRRSYIPPDGKIVGDWKKGEAIAQSGYGLRFTDYPPRSANGGNCYACHQLTKAGGELRHARAEPAPIRQAPQFQRGRHQGGVRENLQFARGVSMLATCRASAPTRS